MKYISKKTKGFTLPELLTVVSVMVVVGTLLASGSDPRSEWREEVRAQEITLINYFNEMRTMALTSSTVEAEGLGGVEIIPQNGYGIHFDFNSNTFTFFADTNNGGLGDNEFTNPGDTILSSYTLDLHNNAYTVTTTLFTTVGSKTLTSGDSFTLFFYPPDASASIIDELSAEYQSLEIYFNWSNVLEEKIKFHKISRFFEREKLFP